MNAKKFANMRKARERKRLESDAPEYPQELPILRRKIVIYDYDFGEKVTVIECRKTKRIDSYRVFANGEDKKNMGNSRIMEMIRKMFPRVRSTRSI